MMKREMLHSPIHGRSIRRGATTVELAFVAPIFFVLVFGVVEFGRALMVKQSLTEAARAGARTASLATTLDTSRAEQAARDYLQQTMTDSFDLNQCRIRFQPSTLDSVARGDNLIVELEVDIDDVTWIAPSFLTDKVLRGEARLTKE